MKFRKKPVVIDAMQFGAPENRGSIVRWLCEHGVTFNGGSDEKGHFIEILTLEGKMRADEGDWIIKGVKGEFYPCKPDIFAATYEPV